LNRRGHELIAQLKEMVRDDKERRWGRTKKRRYHNPLKIRGDTEEVILLAPRVGNAHRFENEGYPYPTYQYLFDHLFKGNTYGGVILFPHRKINDYTFHHALIVRVCNLLDQMGLKWVLAELENALDTDSEDEWELLATHLMFKHLRFSQGQNFIFHWQRKHRKRKIFRGPIYGKGEHIKEIKEGYKHYLQWAFYSRHERGCPVYRFETRHGACLRRDRVTDPRKMIPVELRKEYTERRSKGFYWPDYDMLLREHPELGPYALRFARRSVRWQIEVIMELTGMTRRQIERYFAVEPFPLDIDYQSEWQEAEALINGHI